MNRRLFLTTLTMLCLATSVAWALPSTITAEDQDQDASIVLTTHDQVIAEDARSRCTVSVAVTGDEVQFVNGDTVIVRVLEDDIVGDDILWQEEFAVSEEEVANQRFERTLDCTSAFGVDGFGDIEVYADAEVIKDECGFFCLNDTPTTDNLTLVTLEDDEQEQDDSQDGSLEYSDDTVDNRISTDQDWFTFTVDATSNVSFDVLHIPAFGRLDVAIFDENGDFVGNSTDRNGSTISGAAALPAGTYFARISPRQSNDYNFYDARLNIDATDDTCNPGETQDEACGNCGTRTRTCNDDGQWGPFGECSTEGECVPGDSRMAACGNCGTATITCSDQCTWSEPAECSGEGVCESGATETAECDGGVQVRTCNDMCAWDDYSECMASECTDGERQTCYDGPDGTAGTGVCREGRQLCEGGIWGACQGQIVPSNEACTDGRDNDCDGQADENDDECVGEGAEIGSACEESSECIDDLLCLRPPEHSQFTDGYCGDDDCNNDADCGADGICAEVFGQNFCLRSCEKQADCRTGYICVDLRDTEGACIPRCTSNDDCTDADNPVCDSRSGQCKADDAPGNNNAPDNNGTGNNNAPDNNGTGNNNAPDNNGTGNNDVVDEPEPTASKEEDGCCTVTPARPERDPLAPLLMLSLGAILLVRRQLRKK